MPEDDVRVRAERVRELFRKKIESGGFQKEQEENPLLPGTEHPSDISDLCIFKKMADKGVEESSTFHDSKRMQETCPGCSGYNPECPSYMALKSYKFPRI